MSAEKLFKEHLYMSNLFYLAKKAGIELDVSTDFDFLKSFRSSQNERQAIYPTFDVEKSYIDPTNGFFIIGKNDQGEIVHTQAMRLLDLTEYNLEEHLYYHRHKYITPGTVDFSTTRYKPTPSMKNINGRVCYHGELWIKPGDDGYRNGTITVLVARFALTIAYMNWAPNFIFGFMYPGIACRGLAAREGYVHLEPGGWYCSESDTTIEEWLVWLSYDDMEHIINTPVEPLIETINHSKKI